jgi:hypothetical protein
VTKLITCLLLLLPGSILTWQRDASVRGNRYPNELIGYRLYADGNWKSLEPYVSRED